MRKRMCDAAVEVLRETKNAAVMYGDAGLLYQIAARAGMTDDDRYCWDKAIRVLNALTKQPGILVKKYTLLGKNRRVRIFRLPE